MIKISGLNAFMQKSKKQRALIKQGAANFVRQQTKRILKDLVLNAPQWSGNTAAMWRVETYAVGDSGDLSRLHTADWQSLLPDNVKWKGDKEALRVALEDSGYALQSIRYNSKIALVNNSPVADKIAAQTIKLREGNFIDGDAMAMKLAANNYRMSAEIVPLNSVTNLLNSLGE